MTRILVLHGHPSEEGLTARLTRAFEAGAREAGAEVETLWLGRLSFDPILRHGFRSPQALEPDLVRAQELLSWAEHLAVIYPVWWGGWPALLKGFVDRAVLPGFAFKYSEGGGLPQRLLKGRTARLIVTCDGPVWWDRLVNRSAAVRQMRQSTLAFVGIRTHTVTRLGGVGRAKEARIQAWEAQVRRQGPEAARG